MALEPLTLDTLEAAEITRYLSDVNGARVTVIDKVASTNAVLLTERESYAHRSLLFANQQTAGRGRRGKRWVSPAGVNIYMSVVWDWTHGLNHLGGLSSALGLWLAQALEGAGASELKVKWPNDILWRGRKLCGILIETAQNAPGSDGGMRIVAGVGLNVMMASQITPEAAEIDQPWTTFEHVTAATPARNPLAATMATAVLGAFDEFEARGLAPTVSAWPTYDYLHNQDVAVLRNGEREYGHACGLAADGSLCVDLDGVYHYLNAGEVSIRPRQG